MVCRQLGAWPLPDSVMNCQLDPKKETIVKIWSNPKHLSRLMHVKLSSPKWRSFCRGLNVLDSVLLIRYEGEWPVHIYMAFPYSPSLKNWTRCQISNGISTHLSVIFMQLIAKWNRTSYLHKKCILMINILFIYFNMNISNASSASHAPICLCIKHRHILISNI